MRRVGDIAAFGEASGKCFVRTVSAALRVTGDGVGRNSFQTMLANYNGPALTGFQISRHQEVSPGKDIRPDIQHHFVLDPLWRFRNLASPRIAGKIRWWKAANHLRPKIILVLFAGARPIGGCRTPGLVPKEIVAH